jgi:uncharacterized protein YacL
MFLLILRVLYTCVCIGAIGAYVNPGEGVILPPVVQDHLIAVFFGLLVATQAITIIDLLIPRKRIDMISGFYFGLLIGVLLAYLLVLALEPALRDNAWRGSIVLVIHLIIPYLSVSMLLQTKDDFRFVIPYVEFSRDLKTGRPMVVDTSSLIDGRIVDVVETQILESQMVVPDFVLKEVQDIADSSDKSRRTRGRRGLEVLGKLKTSSFADIKMVDTKPGDYKGMTVDQRIVALAKDLGGGVITNDFNLNKVASVQGIPVVNLNDVANALKPRYIPGERMKMKIIKEGESAGQGVGYLDDGTMVVCENAGDQVGKEIDVVVTSVLQSSAGRMIFGKAVSVFTPNKS